ncbi:hypothetical protein FDF74_03785 [Clostridium niameyense]|uniref:Lipoprotein n=2 Tax=Clostridium niameyense TaxID=1622073 RepID=A0A6M0R7W6_9CLOT|nr:hypothetical protein [Clostridium niameyense]NEZ46332.1 hypothetical protein [Clostridium niameyense]
MIFIVFNLQGCSKKADTKEREIEPPNFSKVTLLEKKNENLNIYEANEEGLFKNGTIKENIMDGKYNLQKSIYVYLNYVSKGKELDKSKISIIKDKTLRVLEDFYNASDIRLSPKASKLAYRTFKEDSLNSAQGMKMYDIENNKEIKLNSKVLISGNLFQWLNEDEIIYYGMIPEEKGSSKIYKYNFREKKEEPYVGDIKGYCSYIVPVKDDVVFISRDNDKSNLYYYKKTTNEFIKISDSIDQAYDYTIDKNHNIYFIANDYIEQKKSLYCISYKDKVLKRLTYDFPTEVNVKGGISTDEKGNVYFIGSNNDRNSSSDGVYIYKPVEGSVNVLSDFESLYYILQGK